MAQLIIHCLLLVGFLAASSQAHGPGFTKTIKKRSPASRNVPWTGIVGKRDDCDVVYCVSLAAVAIGSCATAAQSKLLDWDADKDCILELGSDAGSVLDNGCVDCVIDAVEIVIAWLLDGSPDTDTPPFLTDLAPVSVLTIYVTLTTLSPSPIVPSPTPTDGFTGGGGGDTGGGGAGSPVPTPAPTGSYGSYGGGGCKRDEYGYDLDPPSNC